MGLICTNPKCKHKWEYKGKRKFYTTCPNCLHKVKISDNEKYNNKGRKQ